MSTPLHWGAGECIHKIHKYIADSSTADAHTLETWTPASSSIADGNQKYWVIYVHGGAWWRPMITASSFTLTVQNFLSSPSPLSNIAGFASLNYRLSTPPPLPQFAQFTEPNDPARNVKHPAHLDDIIAALSYLQKAYQFGEKYIVVGHSCGATLAFQLPYGNGIVSPAGVLGVEGIYDLGKLRDDHKEVAMYQYFTESAFGTDEKDWKLASPVTQENGTGFAWQKVNVVALAQSDEDELVDVNQRDLMWDVIKKHGVNGRKDELIQLVGKHDEIWREGNPETQLKIAIEKVLGLLTAG